MPPLASALIGLVLGSVAACPFALAAAWRELRWGIVAVLASFAILSMGVMGMRALMPDAFVLPSVVAVAAMLAGAVAAASFGGRRHP